MRKKAIVVVGAVVLVIGTAIGAAAVSGFDFGLFVQRAREAGSSRLYGVDGVLRESSPDSISQEEAEADPASLIQVARSLRVEVVASSEEAGADLDMMALWPNDSDPTHLLFCNEGGPEDPGLQRIELATGDVTTMLFGTDSCDGVRLTAWGSFLFSEEAGGGPEGGRVYELINPLETEDVLLDRTTGEFSGGVGAENFAVRPALGRLSYEGFALYSSGLVYYGDENRPEEGNPGGAYFKFIPSAPFAGGDPIEDLNASPLASGSVYGLRLGLRDEGTDYGQGSNTGLGSWIEVCTGDACNDIDLRAITAELHLTGYYRPEDIDIDRKAEAAGIVKFCGPNTGNESDNQNYGEVICITDGTLSEAMANEGVPEAQYFVIGYPELSMPDNIAYQPGRGNWVVHEDAPTEEPSPHNNDLWDCLPDGRDDDLLSDGCVRVATLRDLTAEMTGGIFDAAGKKFYASIQHNITGHGVVLLITGWR